MQLLVKRFPPLRSKFKVRNSSVYQQKRFQEKQKKSQNLPQWGHTTILKSSSQTGIEGF